MLTHEPTIDVGPAPDAEPLLVQVPCRTSPNRRLAPDTHEVRIDTHWRASVPHDLGNERIAVALGGRSSCVGLVDRVVPALRAWIGLMLRQGERALFRPQGEHWAVAEPQACCQGRTFPGPADAALHARSIPHVAAWFGADWELLTLVAAAASRAYGSRFELRIDEPLLWPASDACTGGIVDVEYLFRCGLAPSWVVDIHALKGATEPLDRAYYLAVVVGPTHPLLSETDPAQVKEAR